MLRRDLFTSVLAMAAAPMVAPAPASGGPDRWLCLRCRAHDDTKLESVWVETSLPLEKYESLGSKAEQASSIHEDVLDSLDSQLGYRPNPQGTAGPYRLSHWSGWIKEG